MLKNPQTLNPTKGTNKMMSTPMMIIKLNSTFQLNDASEIFDVALNDLRNSSPEVYARLQLAVHDAQRELTKVSIERSAKDAKEHFVELINAAN